MYLSLYLLLFPTNEQVEIHASTPVSAIFSQSANCINILAIRPPCFRAHYEYSIVLNDIKLVKNTDWLTFKEAFGEYVYALYFQIFDEDLHIFL
jgi:hypothetical protein